MVAAPLAGLDSCVPLARLLPNPGAVTAIEAAACRALFRALDAAELGAMMSSLGLAETLYALGREGATLEERRAAEAYLQRVLTIVPVDATIASAAAEHRLTHYHRDRSPISYADSVAAVVAQQAGVPLITVDAPLLALRDPRIIRPSQLRLNPS